MSWEEINRSYHRCPCGQNTYSVITLSDDWGRHKERLEMDCPVCQQNYRLFSYWQVEHAKDGFDIHLWIATTDHNKVQGLKAQLERAKVEVMKLARSRYLERWLHSFENVKSKKEVWQRLTNNGQKYPTLPTFYTHIKGNGTSKYLDDWFAYSNLSDGLDILGAQDSDINEQVKKIQEIENELAQTINQLKRTGYTDNPQ